MRKAVHYSKQNSRGASQWGALEALEALDRMKTMQCTGMKFLQLHIAPFFFSYFAFVFVGSCVMCAVEAVLFNAI